MGGLSLDAVHASDGWRDSRPLSRSRFVQLLIWLSVMTSALTQLSPAKAYEVFFNAPNVLGGIRNVPVTLPSTGVTAQYNVLLKKGTFEEIYGSPALTDVDNVVDAQALMEMSANAINAYITATADDSLSFAEVGEAAYSIPYASPYVNTSGTTVVDIILSGKECPAGYYWDGSKCVSLVSAPTNLPVPNRLISPRLTSVPVDQISVWAYLQPVPGPLPLAGGLVAWRWARMLRQRRKQDRC